MRARILATMVESGLLISFMVESVENTKSSMFISNNLIFFPRMFQGRKAGAKESFLDGGSRGGIPIHAPPLVL